MPRKLILNNPTIVQKIIELKSQGKSDSEIARVLFDDFGVKVFRTTIGKIYNNLQKEKLEVPDEEKIINEWKRKINDKLRRIDKVTDILLKKIEELEDLEPEQYIKIAPIVLSVRKEILEEMAIVRKQSTLQKAKSPLDLMKDF
jgi:intein-encoded DNA endonuclease-like protein